MKIYTIPTIHCELCLTTLHVRQDPKQSAWLVLWHPHYGGECEQADQAVSIPKTMVMTSMDIDKDSLFLG